MSKADLKAYVLELTKKLSEANLSEFKDKRYITALENQIKKMSSQLKEPSGDFTSMLRELNNATIKDRNYSKEQIEALDLEIDKKINDLLI